MGGRNVRRRSLCAWGVIAIGLLGGCASASPSDTQIVQPPAELPVLAAYVGTFDGQELHLQTVDEYLATLRAAGGDVAASRQQIDTLTSQSYGSGTNGSGTNKIALEQVSSTRRVITNSVSGTNSWGPTGECGGTPTTGVCVQIRARNLYTQQAERVYVQVTALTATGSTSAVSIPAQASNTWTAATDFGLTPAVSNGLWRYGTLGRSAPTGTSAVGPPIRWTFNGTTPMGQSFTFSFTVIVRGLLVRDTQRASLASTGWDSDCIDAASSDYPDRSTAGVSGASCEGTSSNTNSVAISQSGRYVVFAASVSSNAAAQGLGVTSGTHIIRRDMTTGTNVLISIPDNDTPVATGCTAANPHISADGNVVVFSLSGATCDLGAGTSTNPQIYVRNVTATTTTLVSKDTGGGFADAAALNPRISADGNVVVFDSAATDLVAGHPGGRSGCREVYRYQIDADTMHHVSVLRNAAFYDDSDGWTASCSSTLNPGTTPDVSGDGNLVAFVSRQALDSGTDADTNQDIYVYDFGASQGGSVAVYQVSLTSSGGALSGSGTATTANNHPTLSSNGSFVAFTSDHTNVTGASSSTSGRRHVYLRSTSEGSDGTIQRVSVSPADAEGSSTSFATPWPAVSPSGRFVAFWSSYTNLASATGYSPSGSHVYVCDTDAGHSSLSRCWLASQAVLASTDAAFTNTNASSAGTARIGIAADDADTEAGYVVYQGNPSNWGGMNGSGNQVFVSPYGDPRFQQAQSGGAPTVAP